MASTNKDEEPHRHREKYSRVAAQRKFTYGT